jgi:hypothetical protein
MNASERWLKLLLRLGGVLTGSAIFAVFLPEATMASTHESLGLGEFPAAPLTDYLTRSLSAMYAFHGAILLALSTDVRRYKPVIVVVAWATAVMGVVVTGVDLWAPMPIWWTLGEGPWVVLMGLALLSLARRVQEPPRAS